MPTLLSVANIIEIGDVSTYLSANYTSKQELFGGSIAKPNPPVQIAYITDALRWGVEGGAETDANNRAMANYLLWLCGMFQLEAQRIVNGAGGGSVVPPPSGSGTAPNPYDFEVSAISTPLADGESSATLTSFIGYNVDVLRGGIGQNTTNTGGSYFQWNRITGLFQVFPAVSTGELLRITPV